MKPSRQSRAAKALRTGLAWRAQPDGTGRPRWEPSPSSRRAGLKGKDLRREDGAWMSHGEAVDLCERRALWAGLIRDAAAGGPRAEIARADLHQVLAGLEPPQDGPQRHRRQMLQDLVDAATALLGAPAKPGPAPSDAHSLARLVEGYLADVDAGKVKIADSTASAYRNHLTTRFAPHFAGLGVTACAAINRAKLIAFYDQLVESGLSLANANQCLGAVGAAFSWATRQDPPWLAATPATKLGLETPPGRLVFIELEEERPFVAWCDAHDYADIADAITCLLWTGASPVDACKANLSHLRGDTWSYSRQKTGQPALPGITAPLRERVDRRAQQVLTAIDAPFLVDHRTGRRHDPDSLRRRFLDAKNAAIAAGAAPESFAPKRLQDCRDTCLTRLWEADVKPHRMGAWTGHSAKSVERILRKHYLVLRDKGSMVMAAKLEAWAARGGVGL